MTFGDGFFTVFKGAFKAFFDNTFNMEEEINEVIDEHAPFLMVGPHIAIEDSLIAIAYSRKLIRFLAAEGNMDTAWKNAAFRVFNVIPFARQRLDIKAIRRLTEAIAKGHPVGLFPEGARSWDGRNLPIIPSTAKLVKMLGVPVYNVAFKGLYLSRPRWAEGNGRKGKVLVSIKRVFTQEEVAHASLDEVLKELEAAVAYDEFVWQRNAMVRFAGKNYAEYIERILYRCPSCGGLNTLASKGDQFSCRACGAQYAVNAYGFIEGCARFDNTGTWNAWQQGNTHEFLKTTYSFENPSIFLIRSVGKKRFKDIVDMILTERALSIAFPDGTETEIPLSETRGCDALFGDMVEFWYGDIKYRFRFDPLKRHMSVKLFEDILSVHIEAAQQMAEDK